MTIPNKTRLGPYEVVSAIGAGGMGEVYRARDERIGRDVAIKVLPETFAENEERLRRFEQEARAAGGLNHPNLVTIHDIGRHDGAPYLVMELLEGESLREKLGAGGSGAKVPVRKAIEYATQIAQGLAAAHDKGIVHRDLKPDNVFVTNDGRVKILDFGLAKQEGLLAPEGATDQQTAQRGTSPGAVMGTVGYMSPEQVRGRQVDQRTDIFAFGTILYEILSGERAFRGDSTADTMSAILHQDPPELSGEGLAIPLALDRIVHRCLEKNREERFHSAHDLALALELLSGSSSSTSGAVALDRRTTLGAKRLMGIAAAVVAIVAAFVIGRASRPDRLSATAAVSKEPRLTQLTFMRGSETNPGISPDGGTIVYSAGAEDGDWDIFALRVGGEKPVNLTSDLAGRNAQPAFSPDGGMIAFVNLGNEAPGLYVMGATGEARRRLTEFGGDPCWTPDGRAILISTEPVFSPMGRVATATLWRVDVSSTEATAIDTRGRDAVQPTVAPDGKRIAFWGLPEGTGRRVIYTMALEGGEPVPITEDDFFNWNPEWSPDGERLFFASNRGGSMNLWSTAVDRKTGESVGAFEPVTIAGQYNGQMSIASDGRIVFATATVSERIVRVPVDRLLNVTGPAEMIVAGSREIWDLDVTADGTQIVFKGFDDREDLFVAAADGSGIRRLTNDRFKDRQPGWATNPELIYFFSDRSGRYEIWRIRADGGRLEQVTSTTGENPSVATPSPDGRYIGFVIGEQSAVAEIGETLPITKWEPWPNPDERTKLWAKAWSHDSARVVAIAMLDGTVPAGVWVCEVDGLGCSKIADRGFPISWTPDDAAIVIRDESSGKMRLVDLTTRKISEGLTLPAEVSDAREFNNDVTLSADGKWLWYIEEDREQDIWMMEHR